MRVVRLFIFLCAFLLLSIPANAIKIGLIDSTPITYVGTSTIGDVIDVKTKKIICKLEAMQPYKFKAKKNKVYIQTNRQEYNLGSDFIAIRPTNKGFCSAKSRWYRGELLLKAQNGKLTVINNLNIESYIRGVVPSEMPSRWNIEAHKAQAIAARSYAVANLQKRGASGYDLKDTPEDQAYGGASSETVQTNKACDDTKGIVLTYDQKVIPAYYSASAGGHTINSGDIWAKNLPYLKAVPSYDGNIKKNGHGVGMSQHGANNLAKRGYNAYQILCYFYNNVKFGKLDPSWPL